MKFTSLTCVGFAYASALLSAPVVLAQTSSLDQVVVTASRYSEDAQAVPSSLVVISQQDIRLSGSSTVNEAIARLSGIVARPSLYGGNEISLDLGGFGDAAASNLVVVVDGVPYKQGDSSEVRLSSLSIDQIEQIEIQRGSSTVLYGEGAIGGVINIITKANARSYPSGQFASVSVGVGSNHTQEERASATYVKDGLVMNYAGLNRSSNGFRQQSNNTDRNNNLSMQYKGAVGRMGLYMTNTAEYAQTPGGLTFAQYTSDRTQAQPDSLVNKTWNRGFSDSAGVFGELEFQDIVWRFDYKKRNKDYSALAVQSGLASHMNFATTNDVLSVSANKSVQLNFGKNSLVAGVENNHWVQGRRYPDSSDSIGLSSKSSAIFAKNDFEINTLGTRVSAGYRSEQLQKSQYTQPGGVFTPGLLDNQATLHGWELGLSISLSATDTIYARRAKGYRLPNIDEMGSAPWDPIANTNAALNPQTSIENEVGWKSRAIQSTRLGLRAYQSELRNELIYDPQQVAVINLDPTRRKGVELDALYSMTRQLQVGGVLSWRDAKIVDGTYVSKLIPMVPSRTATLRANWSLTDQHSVGAYWTYVGVQQVAGDFNNQTAMPSYAVTDLRYGYRLNSLEVSLMIRNLFNRAYYSYATDVYPWGSARYTSVYPDNLRNFMAVAKYTFR